MLSLFSKKPKQPVSYVPGLATEPDAAAAPEKVKSDHRPRVGKFTVSEGDKKEELTAIIWNIDDPRTGGSGNGRDYSTALEGDDKYRIAKKNGILTGLKTMMEAQKPVALVHLQEAFFEEAGGLFAPGEFEKAFPNMNLVKEGSVLTLYDPAILDLMPRPEQDAKKTPAQPQFVTSHLELSFKTKKNGIAFTTHNVHLQHQEFPQEQQKYLTELQKKGAEGQMDRKESKESHFVFGDANGRVARPDEACLINNTVANEFRLNWGRNAAQGCDSTDFMLGPEDFIPTLPLNPETGKSCALTSEQWNTQQRDFTDFQHIEVNRQRPALEIGATLTKYRTVWQEEFMDKSESFPAEDIEKLFKENGVVFGLSTNMSCQTMPALHFTHGHNEFTEFLKDHLKRNDYFTVESNMVGINPAKLMEARNIFAEIINRYNDPAYLQAYRQVKLFQTYAQILYKPDSKERQSLYDLETLPADKQAEKIRANMAKDWALVQGIGKTPDKMEYAEKRDAFRALYADSLSKQKMTKTDAYKRVGLTVPWNQKASEFTKELKQDDLDKLIKDAAHEENERTGKGEKLGRSSRIAKFLQIREFQVDRAIKAAKTKQAQPTSTEFKKGS